MWDTVKIKTDCTVTATPCHSNVGYTVKITRLYSGCHTMPFQCGILLKSQLTVQWLPHHAIPMWNTVKITTDCTVAATPCHSNVGYCENHNWLYSDCHAMPFQCGILLKSQLTVQWLPHHAIPMWDTLLKSQLTVQWLPHHAIPMWETLLKSQDCTVAATPCHFNVGYC